MNDKKRNQSEVLKSFLNCEEWRASNLRSEYLLDSDVVQLISYATTVAVYDRKLALVYLTTKNYSHSTSCQISGLRRQFASTVPVATITCAEIQLDYLPIQQGHSESDTVFNIYQYGESTVAKSDVLTAAPAKPKKHETEKTCLDLHLLYRENIPSYVKGAGKEYFIIRVPDPCWSESDSKDLKITPEAVIAYYKVDARNITSGCRTIAGYTGDWRNIDFLAKEALEWFKLVNVEKLRRLAKENGFEARF